MRINNYCYDGSGKFKLSDYDTGLGKKKLDKKKILTKTEENIAQIAELQDKLYADSKEAILIILQAMDAAGKDGTIKHVMSGINPQGVDVYSFKQPSSDELAHDFLWRIHSKMPAKGKIAIFNRSYYEDVLVARVRELNKTYQMPERCKSMSTEKFFDKRYKHIKHYEEFLYDNGCRIVKLFLNVSKDTQKKRFMERIDNPAKNWKFSSSDIKERKLWDDYQEAYTLAIENTSTKECPWYIIPADKKWYMRYLVSEAVLKTLKACNSQYPVLADEEIAKLGEYKAMLENEE